MPDSRPLSRFVASRCNCGGYFSGNHKDGCASFVAADPSVSRSGVSQNDYPRESSAVVADTTVVCTTSAHHPRAEQIARAFHEAYEDLAPEFGYRTRKTSAVPWDEVPSGNKELMKATVTRLLDRGVFRWAETKRRRTTMIDIWKLAQMDKSKPLKVRYGPRREVRCAISGCPVDGHTYWVRLPNGGGTACSNCAGERGFELDWSTV